MRTDFSVRGLFESLNNRYTLLSKHLRLFKRGRPVCMMTMPCYVIVGVTPNDLHRDKKYKTDIVRADTANITSGKECAAGVLCLCVSGHSKCTT
jgi:hypothetical protein